jgi:hypothetical protein
MRIGPVKVVFSDVFRGQARFRLYHQRFVSYSFANNPRGGEGLPFRRRGAIRTWRGRHPG